MNLNSEKRETENIVENLQTDLKNLRSLYNEGSRENKRLLSVLENDDIQKNEAALKLKLMDQQKKELLNENSMKNEELNSLWKEVQDGNLARDMAAHEKEVIVKSLAKEVKGNEFLRKRIEGFEKELMRANENKANNEETLESLRRKIIMQERMMENMEENVQIAENDHQCFKKVRSSEIDNLKKMLDENREEFQVLEVENKNLKEICKKENMEIMFLKTKIENVSAEYEQERKKISKRLELKEVELGEKKANIENLEMELIDIRMCNKDMNNAFGEEKKICEHAKEEIIKIQKERDCLSQKVVILEKIKCHLKENDKKESTRISELMEENKELRKHIIEDNKLNDELKKKVEEEKIERQNVSQKNEDLERLMDSQKETLKRLENKSCRDEKEIVRLREILTSIDVENREIVTESNARLEAIKNLKKDVENMKKITKEREREIYDLRIECHKIHEKCKSEKEEKKRLEEICKDTFQRCEYLEKQSCKKEVEIEKFLLQLKEEVKEKIKVENDVSTLKRILVEKDKTLDETAKEIDGIKGTCSQLRIQLKECKIEKKQEEMKVEAEKTLSQDLKLKMTQEEKKVLVLEGKLDKNLRIIERSKMETADAERKLQTFEEKVWILLDDVKNAKIKIEAAERKAEEKTTENKGLLKDRNVMEKIMADFKRMMNEKCCELQKLQASKEDLIVNFEKLREEKNLERNMRESHEFQIGKMQATIKAAHEKLCKETSDMDLLKKRNSELKERHEILENEISKYKQRYEDGCEVLIAEIDKTKQMAADENRCQMQIVELREERDFILKKWFEEKEELSQENADLKSRCKEQDLEFEELEVLVEIEKQKNNRVCREMEKLKKEHMNAAERCVEIENELNVKKNELSTEKEMREKRENKIEVLKKRTKEIEAIANRFAEDKAALQFMFEYVNDETKILQKASTSNNTKQQSFK